MNRPMLPERPDLVILGSGSTAFAAALAADARGKSAVMIERRTLGGTCVNRGCLPSKNLIEAAKLLHDVRNPRFPGFRTDGAGLSVDFSALIEQKDEVIRTYRNKKYDSLVGGRISVLNGDARFLDANTVDVDGVRLSAARFLVATGSRPATPDIEGLDRVSYLTSDLLTHGEDEELRTLPEELLVVGGGYIAVELGQMFARFGSRVTIVNRNPQLLAHGYEREIGRILEEAFTAEGITVLNNAVVRSVRRGDDGSGIVADIAAGAGSHKIAATHLLIATGRRPNSDEIGAEAAGIAVNGRGEIEVDDTLRSSVPHIFAAGDVIGRQHLSQMATPVGARQGSIAADNALDHQPQRRFDGRVIPRAIFTDPPVGVVGMTEQEAVAAGHRCWCRPLPMDLVPRAGAIRDMRGSIRVVADADTNEVLGVAMVGAAAPEVIHEAAMAMKFHATLSDFVDLIHVYPTMAEALKIGAIARTKDPARLSCCAE